MHAPQKNLRTITRILSNRAVISNVPLDIKSDIGYGKNLRIAMTHREESQQLSLLLWFCIKPIRPCTSPIPSNAKTYNNIATEYVFP